MNINKINKIAQDNIAHDDKKNLKSAKGFKRIDLLLDIVNKKNLNDKDTNKLIDAFEKLGVKICFSKNDKLVAIPKEFKKALMLNKNKNVK